jgi:diaminopimelate epimerase
MHFFKYQGTGNDFILVDIRGQQMPQLDIAAICHRRFGIGADGLMFLAEKPGYDFEMIYFNSDGKPSSMCGNGGRCIAKFAHSLGLGNENKLSFIAVDGPHEATIKDQTVALGMKPVLHLEKRDTNTYVLNTGSPHFVNFIQQTPADFQLLDFARKIRYNAEFNQEGINVNIVQVTGPNSIAMRTYERGVEDETYSCGTGVTAAALAFQLHGQKTLATVQISTPGGNLQVHSQKTVNGFENIILEGPAEFVFNGEI